MIAEGVDAVRRRLLSEGATLDVPGGPSVARQQLDTQASTVRQYEGAVKLDKGQIDNARVQLAYCHIKAPIEGRVVSSPSLHERFSAG